MPETFDPRAALAAHLAESFASLGLPEAQAVLRVSDRPELADYQCNGALGAAKALGTNPRALAERLVADLSARIDFAEIGIAGPGFINFRLTDACLLARLGAVSADPSLLVRSDVAPRRIFIDYGGPNVAKPMHVGHLRSSIIGETLKRLCLRLGHEVVGDIHLGDWGTQMGMLIREVEREKPGLPYFDPAYTGPWPQDPPVTLEELEIYYPRVSKACKEDEAEAAACRQATAELQAGRPGYRALWEQFVAVSRAAIEREFEALGVRFDQWFGESRYQDRLAPLIDRLLASGLAKADPDGSVIVPFPPPDVYGKEVPPLVIRKSDGAFLYASTDLATIEERVSEMGARTIFYVVDLRQALHFEQVFWTARAAGIAPAPDTELELIGFGTMNGTDGKPFKTRAGGVMKLGDLIALLVEEADRRLTENFGDKLSVSPGERADIARKVGIAALKFADLQHERTKNYIFDIAKFTRFEGKTGPYLLYTGVRIRSLLARLGAEGFAAGTLRIETAEDRALVLHLIQLGEALNEAFRRRMPHVLCDYAYGLAQLFNAFYQKTHILSETDAGRRGSWIALCEASLSALEALYGILGIELPDRM